LRADKTIGLEFGADDYVPKPFNARDLLVRVTSLFRRAQILRSNYAALASRYGPDVEAPPPAGHSRRSPSSRIAASRTS